jgi:hypothetical protein
MNADVERFFEECRADPWFRERLDDLDLMEERFEKFYLDGDESAEWQDIWDRIREVVTRKEPVIERFKVLGPMLREILID